MENKLRLAPFFEPIREEMERMERVLRETVNGFGEPLNSMLHRLMVGGKRLRPALVILAGRVFSPDAPRAIGISLSAASDRASGPTSDPAAPFYDLAAAVEMLHTATLIHDDLVDGSPLRRGRATLHTTWSAGATVLAGDYLMAKASGLVADLGSPRLLKIFAETLCAMCSGEIQQLCFTGGKRRTREAYYRHIESKTASLCAAATEMAGVLAGAAEAHVGALRHFGRELGMAFQIADDVLDFVGEEERLGKPAGSDLRQGLVTLPAIWYLERVPDDVVLRAVLDGQRDAEHVRAAVQAVRASGAIEAAMAEARAHALKSQRALADLPDSAPRRMLCALAEYAVERGR